MAAANPPIALPPFNNVINLPPQPENPPVASDIVAAHKYKKEVIIAHEDFAVGDNALADAVAYELSLVQARAGAAVAPPWFDLAIQQLGLGPRLDNLTTLMTRSLRLSAKSYNMASGSGTVRSFEIVLFLDGSDPTAEPHNLPPLLDTAAVAALDAHDTKGYYRGYHGPGNLPPVVQRKPAILIAIGAK